MFPISLFMAEIYQYASNLRRFDHQKIFEGVRDLLNDLYPSNEPLTFERFSEVVEREPVIVMVAEEEQRIVGTASMAHYRKLGGDVFVIEDVDVHPEFRGRGIGKALTMRLLDTANNLGARSVDVNTRRESARDFYVALGFEEKGEKRPFFSLRKTL